MNELKEGMFVLYQRTRGATLWCKIVSIDSDSVYMRNLREPEGKLMKTIVRRKITRVPLEFFN